MTIHIGTGGTPKSSEDRSTISGLKRLKELGLTAMEVEFVYGVRMGSEMAEEVGELAKKLGITLSIHAPYYINLTSTEKKKIEASKRRIIKSCERGHTMGAKIVVFHPAYYGKLSQEETYERVKQECEEIIERLKEKGIKDVIVGLETTGKKSQFGNIDECIKIVKNVKGCGVCIDWAHVYARNGGKINFGEIIDKVLTLKNKHIHSHFSGIKFSDKGERNHLTISSKQPDYKELVKEIKKRNLDITLISESPNLEKDALKLKSMLNE
ncbi:MAG: TIM barrel protein [Candidatus Aenigmarchaeota archaeon]|nr:TIM barrel protein [Candidatus Aenigmarchaeota archaeon]